MTRQFYKEFTIDSLHEEIAISCVTGENGSAERNVEIVVNLNKNSRALRIWIQDHEGDDRLYRADEIGRAFYDLFDNESSGPNNLTHLLSDMITYAYSVCVEGVPSTEKKYSDLVQDNAPDWIREAHE